MKKYVNETINELYYFDVLENGLKVYLYPKKEFFKTYAIFSTKYGSQDIEFTPIDKNEYIKTPEGIAHFLEHKLFETSDGNDASNLFAKIGGDVNAFTTSNQTAYVFSTTSNVEKNIELLIDFVQEPYFNKEGISKEQGIIEQELLMYLDQPQSVQYFGVLKGMYKDNSVRNEIGGSVDSIKEINEELLYTCYNTFYHPSNMTIAIVGNFDVDTVMELIKKNQAKKEFLPFKEIKRKYYLEDSTINEINSYVEMDVNIPKVSVGIKLPYENDAPLDSLRKNIALEILTDIYFDESSENYEKLMTEEVLNNSFSYEVYYEQTYRHLIFSLDTNEPELFSNRIKDVIDKIRHKKIDEETFAIYKRLYMARNIRRFNSLEYIANLMVEFEQNGLNLFDLIELTSHLTIDNVNEVRKYFDSNSVATFIIYPKAK